MTFVRLTSQSLSSFMCKMGKVIILFDVVRTEWGNVDSCFAQYSAYHKCLINVTLYWLERYLFCHTTFKRNIEIYFCYFKEIRNESHDYPHRVAKFPENRNRNRYRDVSPCKYLWVYVHMYVGWFISGGRIQWKRRFGVRVDKYSNFFQMNIIYILERKFSRCRIVEGRKIAHINFIHVTIILLYFLPLFFYA